MSNKKASFIAIIAVVVIFLIYDNFKPLSEEKIIAKQGVATVYLDNSYKNIDSTNSAEGTLLAQYSQRHNISVVITGSYLTEAEKALSLAEYAATLSKDIPENSTLTIINIDPDNEEITYTLDVPEKLYSWQRLKRDNTSTTVISVVAESPTPKVDPKEILNRAEFGVR